MESGTTTGAQRPSPDVYEPRKLPPVAQLIVVSVTLMISSGVYLASHLPKAPPLGPALGLVAAGGLFTVVAMVTLATIKDFAWKQFFVVARWAFVAYLVISGLLGFVFIYDHTRGATLYVLIASLVVFALDVPTIIAFTVARYQNN